MQAFANDRALWHEEIVVGEDLLRLFSDESIFATELSDNQKHGVAFVLHREQSPFHQQFGGLICNELGTGKTLLTLASIVLSKIKKKPHRERTLVLAPASVLYTWKAEGEKHFRKGVLNCGVYHGSNRYSLVKYFWEECDVIITSYSTLWRDWSFVNKDWKEDSLMSGERRFRLTRLVLDEAHHIRNPSTDAFCAATTIVADYKWCITSTPIWNSMDDIWPLIKVLGAWPLCNRVSWMLEMNQQVYKPFLLAKLIEFLRPIMLRQDKASLNLPPKEETVQHIPMTEKEGLFYQALYANSRNKIARLFEIEKWLKNTTWAKTLRQRASMNVMNIFLRMRQACVHPQIVLDAFDKRFGSSIPRTASSEQLFEDAVSRLNAENLDENCAVCMDRKADHAAVPCGHRFCGDCFAILETLADNRTVSCPMCRRDVLHYDRVEQILQNADQQFTQTHRWALESSKLTWILNDMAERRSRDPNIKFLIFSQWVKVLHIVKKFFDANCITYLTLDGSMSINKRDTIQTQFNSLEDHSVLLISLMAGGQGLNLQRASVVYHLDCWWAAARTDQASNRVYRVGQSRNTTIIHLLAHGTVEEAVFEIQNNKRMLGEKLFGSTAHQEIRRVFNL